MEINSNILNIKNFYYTNNRKSKNGVLFHIPTGRFFRVYDNNIKLDLENTFSNNDITMDAQKMLVNVDTEAKTSINIHECNGCKNKCLEDSKKFTIRKLALVLTSSLKVLMTI